MAEALEDGVVSDNVGRDGHEAEEIEGGIGLAGLAEASDHHVVGDDVGGGAGGLKDGEHAGGVAGASVAAEAADEAGAGDDVGNLALDDHGFDEAEALVEFASVDEAEEVFVGWVGRAAMTAARSVSRDVEGEGACSSTAVGDGGEGRQVEGKWSPEERAEGARCDGWNWEERGRG